jgi:hypothetical protein
MVKLILTGVWVAIVTLAAVYFSIQFSKPEDPNAADAKKKATEELVRGELTTFPVIENGSVEGYFLTKTSYIADKNKIAAITLPIPELLTDQLYTELVGDNVIRIGDNRKFNLKAFRDRVKDALNKRLGDGVILDVIVEQIDYLTKEDLRANMNQSGVKPPMEHIAGDQVPADVPQAADQSQGH